MPWSAPRRLWSCSASPVVASACRRAASRRRGRRRKLINNTPGARWFSRRACHRPLLLLVYDCDRHAAATPSLPARTWAAILLRQWLCSHRGIDAVGTALASPRPACEISGRSRRRVLSCGDGRRSPTSIASVFTAVAVGSLARRSRARTPGQIYVPHRVILPACSSPTASFGRLAALRALLALAAFGLGRSSAVRSFSLAVPIVGHIGLRFWGCAGLDARHAWAAARGESCCDIGRPTSQAAALLSGMRCTRARPISSGRALLEGCARLCGSDAADPPHGRTRDGSSALGVSPPAQYAGVWMIRTAVLSLYNNA